MFHRQRYWLAAIFVALLNWFFATHYFSGDATARVVITLLPWLFPAATPHILWLLHEGIRKLAHVSEFRAFTLIM